MSHHDKNLSLVLASLLLAGNLDAFHAMSMECEDSAQTIGRALDIFHVLRSHAGRR